LLKTLLRQARARIDYLDAVLIMAFVLNRSKESIMIARDDESLSPEEAVRFMDLVSQRASHKPLAYITGNCEFMGLDFEVNGHTLIPRPDTEIVVETALHVIKQAGIKTILDICTGSGCIAVSLSVLCPAKLNITASDINGEALKTAEKNAAKHGASISFIQSDMFRRIDPSPYELIIANPPYIPHYEIDALPCSVRDYEPRAALDGGPDGLDFYRILAGKAVNYIIFEIGYNQAQDVKNILEQRGFQDIQIIKDLAGRNRVISARKNG